MWPWTLWRQCCKNPEWFVYYPVNSQSHYRQREAWQRWKSCCLQKPGLLSFQRRFVHLCWVFVSLLLARLSLLMHLLGRIRWMQCTDAISCCRCSVICVTMCLSVELHGHMAVRSVQHSQNWTFAPVDEAIYCTWRCSPVCWSQPWALQNGWTYWIEFRVWNPVDPINYVGPIQSVRGSRRGKGT